MQIKLLSIGKTKASWLQEGLAEYHKRLKHYCRFSETEIAGLKKTGNLSQKEQSRKEGALLMDKIADNDYLVLLDVDSKMIDSPGLATWLEKRTSRSSIVFVIGGAYGFSEAIYARADERISLSKMTFSHQLVRLLFAEQLYRAFSIQKGEPYHH